MQAPAAHLVGVLEYMDPVAQMRRVFTRESDVYSLGILLLQLLSGRSARELVALIGEAQQEAAGGYVWPASLPDPRAPADEWRENVVREWLRISLALRQLAGYSVASAISLSLVVIFAGART